MTNVMKHFILSGIALSAVILGISFWLIFSAATGGPKAEVGCWEVTDVTGHVSRFTTAPQYDLNVHAIKFEKEGHAGWIFPARVDEDLACAGQ